MKALITGATSGIGKDMAKYLSHKGYDLILASRNTEKMERLQKALPTNVQIITADLSNKEECFALYEAVKDQTIDILVNNAGFGILKEFSDTELEEELNMIDLNIVAVQVLTKLFLADFRKRNKGYILNVASSAGFFAGPLMSTYYATKNYVLRLTEAIYEELRREGSNVSVSALCPGPVDTAFHERAGVEFSIAGLPSKKVAKYAIDQMFLRKLIIIPGTLMKFAYFGGKILPEKMLLRVVYYMQHKKEG